MKYIKLRGIIFDIDGTLANTIPVCFEAYRHAFDKFLGHHFSDEEMFSFFGPTDEGLIKRLVPDQWEDCSETYFEAYEKAHQKCRKPFPGIEKALITFKKHGLKLGIATGKGIRSTEITLRILDITKYFDEIETGSVQGAIKSLSIKKIFNKWGFQSGEVAYIGDTAYDIKAARGAAVIPLGAAWSTTVNINALKKEKPEEIFATIESFTNWVTKKV